MYRQHPLSAAFPAMPAESFLSLKDSVENIGVQNPITIYEGMVLDGWHRYSASVELGMHCPEVVLGDVDPVDFVRAQNKERRHLTVGAWALIETELWHWKPAHRPPTDNSALGADLSKSSAEIAASAGVSVRSVEQAKRVGRDAIPEIKGAVKDGSMSLKTAESLSRLPADEQTVLAAQGPDALRRAAKDQAPKPTGSKPAPQSEIDELRVRMEELEDLNAAYQDRNAELEEENKRLQLSADPDVLARISELRVYSQTVEQTRDHLMNENAQLKQQIKRLTRAADKKGAA